MFGIHSIGPGVERFYPPIIAIPFWKEPRVSELANSTAEKQQSVTESKPQGISETVKSLALLVFVALMLRGTVVEAFKIPSSSMEPTLQIGDHIFVNKLSYGLRMLGVTDMLYRWGTPDRGDIVVFTRPDDPATPEDESETNLIKRVIGLPGDRLEVRGTEVMINDHLYTEDSRYARWVHGGIAPFGPVTVPEGRVILLGDNRDQSRDSRFWNDPFLPVERIKGRAFFIWWNSLFQFRRMFTVLH